MGLDFSKPIFFGGGEVIPNFLRPRSDIFLSRKLQNNQIPKNAKKTGKKKAGWGVGNWGLWKLGKVGEHGKWENCKITKIRKVEVKFC